MFDQQCREWRTQIEEDVNDYNNIERYLDQLQRPYGFLDFRAQRESNIGMSFDFIKEEAQKRNQFKAKHPELHRIEKRIIDQTVDKYVTKVVRKMGWRRANWLGVTWTLIAFQCVTNAFTCYYRADFLTTLVNTLAILYLNDLDGLDRDHFRWLPLLQVVSIGYDLAWLLILQDLDNESQLENGLEGSIKRFSLSLSYVQFFFKFLIFFVLWKVSYNYLVDIRQCPDAPRIQKILKIRQEFAPDAVQGVGGGSDYYPQYIDDNVSGGQSYAQYRGSDNMGPGGGSYQQSQYDQGLR